MIGFLTLLLAYNLSLDGDTFIVLQAVLDTQFWLATHVVTITLGYAATYAAGAWGIVYILFAHVFPLLDDDARRKVLRMLYGTLCFAIFFSFVGTVLGGLWADDSWGRFWGWDPKENGALMIVLWNALVLHARWGGLVKGRGLATLAIGGNIVTTWSYFGVNEFGVGLHAYGAIGKQHRHVAAGVRGLAAGDHRPGPDAAAVVWFARIADEPKCATRICRDRNAVAGSGWHFAGDPVRSRLRACDALQASMLRRAQRRFQPADGFIHVARLVRHADLRLLGDELLHAAVGGDDRAVAVAGRRTRRSRSTARGCISARATSPASAARPASGPCDPTAVAAGSTPNTSHTTFCTSASRTAFVLCRASSANRALGQCPANRLVVRPRSWPAADGAHREARGRRP